MSETMSEAAVIRETRFSSIPIKTIDVNVIGTIVLKKGVETKVEIEADEKSLKNVITSCSNGKLKISTKKGTQTTSTTVFITVTDEDLKCILKAVGTLKTEGMLSLNSLSIEANAVGTIDALLECTKFTLEGKSIGTVHLSGSSNHFSVSVQSVGTFRAVDLVCQEVDFKASAIDSPQIRADLKLILAVKACPIVFLRGEPTIDKSESAANLKIEKI